jgi:hypothetical protein
MGAKHLQPTSRGNIVLMVLSTLNVPKGKFFETVTQKIRMHASLLLKEKKTLPVRSETWFSCATEEICKHANMFLGENYPLYALPYLNLTTKRKIPFTGAGGLKVRAALSFSLEK